MTRVSNRAIYEGIFVEVTIQGIIFPEDLAECNFFEWTNDNMRTDRLQTVAPISLI